MPQDDMDMTAVMQRNEKRDWVRLRVGCSDIAPASGTYLYFCTYTQVPDQEQSSASKNE
jgi:hypothetical protein